MKNNQLIAKQSHAFDSDRATLAHRFLMDTFDFYNCNPFQSNKLAFIQ